MAIINDMHEESSPQEKQSKKLILQLVIKSAFDFLLDKVTALYLLYSYYFLTTIPV